MTTADPAAPPLPPAWELAEAAAEVRELQRRLLAVMAVWVVEPGPLPAEVDDARDALADAVHRRLDTLLAAAEALRGLLAERDAWRTMAEALAARDGAAGEGEGR